MKNIITTAALLAAGTLAMNAETVLKTTFNNAAQSDPKSVNMINNLDGVAASLTSLTQTNYSTSETSDLTLQTNNNAGTDATFLSPNVNVGNAGSWTSTFDYNLGSNTINLTSITINVAIFASSGYFQGTTTTRSFNFELKIGDAVFSNNNVSITGTGSNAADANATNTEKDVVLSLVSESPFSWTGEDVVLTVSKAPTETNGCFIGLNSISFDGTLAPVPEPSSFGLLAGLGALALVGARRRRR